MKPKVDMLKKIALSISPAATSAAPGKESAPLHCEFIYGIGPQGLTPFEYELAGKTVGDQFCITIDPSEAAEFFRHLPVDIAKRPANHASAIYAVKILNIAPADNREIVGAMANLSSCTGCCGH